MTFAVQHLLLVESLRDYEGAAPLEFAGADATNDEEAADNPDEPPVAGAAAGQGAQPAPGVHPETKSDD